MIANRLAHSGVDGVGGLALGALLVEVIGGLPVTALLDAAVGVNAHAEALLQLEDALEERFLESRELEAQVLRQRLPVQLAMVRGMLENALDLGGEDELAVDNGVVEGLDAEEVARAEQLVLGAIPNGEGEHAAQLVEHVLAPCKVRHKQNLGVGVLLERPTFGFELRAQIAIVVNLAVENDDEVALRVHFGRRTAGVAVRIARRGCDLRVVLAGGANHGLASAFKVDQGQATVAQGDAVVDVLTLAVGAAVRDDVAHGLQRGHVLFSCLSESADAAHALLLGTIWFDSSITSNNSSDSENDIPRRVVPAPL